MSLASSISHYGTDKAIEKFEKYREDRAIMKKKYLNKEITAKELENWINSTKILYYKNLYKFLFTQVFKYNYYWI